jgi:hypothetical protein
VKSFPTISRLKAAHGPGTTAEALELALWVSMSLLLPLCLSVGLSVCRLVA